MRQVEFIVLKREAGSNVDKCKEICHGQGVS